MTTNILTFEEFQNELSLDEGWKENLMAGAVAIALAVGGAKAQNYEAPITSGTHGYSMHGLPGTLTDGVIGQFTSQFEFPTLWAKKWGDTTYKDLGISENFLLAKFVKNKITEQHMYDWNDFVEWMKEKKYSGDPKMDHANYSDPVLQEYLKDHPDFWVKGSTDIRKVQSTIKLYRIHIVNMWKSDKIDVRINGKVVKYSKSMEKYFMTWAI